MEEDSDFDLESGSDSDSQDEEADLNNTMLIQGQTGVGKTALVYALAQELGYKVRFKDLKTIASMPNDLMDYNTTDFLYFSLSRM